MTGMLSKMSACRAVDYAPRSLVLRSAGVAASLDTVSPYQWGSRTRIAYTWVSELGQDSRFKARRFLTSQAIQGATIQTSRITRAKTLPEPSAETAVPPTSRATASLLGASEVECQAREATDNVPPQRGGQVSMECHAKQDIQLAPREIVPYRSVIAETARDSRGSNRSEQTRLSVLRRCSASPDGGRRPPLDWSSTVAFWQNVHSLLTSEGHRSASSNPIQILQRVRKKVKEFVADKYRFLSECPTEKTKAVTPWSSKGSPGKTGPAAAWTFAT
ncbi:hypothetical protein OBBRIDRAFT_803884 [Obba rivulosa]|uniref:Uncharacterized protein n=1 Tax=Obba rivulosa TaxID=1052685 RepID=A0A8E2DNN5_9APHY|nr:hypothetical protein OBBRIDRAFT_803884 [Obba rivulosa]